MKTLCKALLIVGLIGFLCISCTNDKTEPQKTTSESAIEDSQEATESAIDDSQEATESAIDDSQETETEN